MKLWFAAVAALALTAPALAQDLPQPYPMPAPVAPPRDVAYPGVIRIEVDATDLERRIFRVRETIPVAAGGPFTLLLPQWLPGNHAPRGAIDKIGGLVVRAGGQVLPWARHPVEVYAFQVTVPPGVTQLDVEFQFLSPTAPDQGRVVMTPEMLNAQWNNLALYPAGYFSRRIPVEASIRLPAGWGYGTALETASETNGLVRFAPVDFETLVDSPLFAGKHYRRIDLDTGARPVRLHVVADAPELLDAKPDQIEKHRELIRQADKAYGARHFDHYDMLLALTERMGGIGLEHHRSSENASRVDYFTGWAKNAPARNLLPHEYSHSWFGKFRRPADLWTPNFNVPMRGGILWAYEGLDQYWGYVLGSRSGLVSKQDSLDALAMTAATYSLGRPGRQWRSVEDTGADPVTAARRPQPWTSWQRSEDYYSEGQLVWLDADTVIRERSGGKRSLDDFAKAWGGVRDGDWTTYPFTFDDVVKTLNDVEPFDWRGFLDAHLRQVAPSFPLDGLARGGWKLIYSDAPTDFWKDTETDRKIVDFTYSLGLILNREAMVTGVLWEGPAFKAGLTASDRIIAVGGIAYEADRLKDAITRAKTSAEPIVLIVRDGDHFKTIAIDYHGGLKYPRLERLDGKPDLISQIYAPKR